MVMSYFIAGCYFLPLVGGYLADNFFGKYWTIVGFSIPYILGHVILGIESTTFLLDRACAAGDGQRRHQAEHLDPDGHDLRPAAARRRRSSRSDAFAMFYWAINIGAALSSFAMPLIRTRVRLRGRLPVPGGADGRRLRHLRRWASRSTPGRSSRRNPKTPEERRAAGGRACGGSSASSWSSRSSGASSTRRRAPGPSSPATYLDLRLFGYKLEPDMIQGFNPILIILHAAAGHPALAVPGRTGLGDAGDRQDDGRLRPDGGRAWRSCRPPASWRRPQHKVSVLWEIVAYVIITVAEICISVVGPGAGLHRGPEVDEELRHGLLAADGLLRQYLQRPDHALYGKIPRAGISALLALMMIPVTSPSLHRPAVQPR